MLYLSSLAILCVKTIDKFNYLNIYGENRNGIAKLTDIITETKTYHNLLLCLLELMLVCDALQLVTLLHQTCVLHFNLALLVHDFGNLVAHTFRHFFTNIVL